MKKILVCGGCGFIGSHFIRFTLQNYPDDWVLNFDKLTYSGNPENLADVEDNDHHKFVRGDIADRAAVEDVFQKFEPDYLINFAAETHVDRSIHVGSEEFIETNVKGVFSLLEAVKKFGVEKYVQVSTDEVYGNLGLDEVRKFTETTTFEPNVPYSATKAGGDLLCRAYHFTYKTPVVVTHCSNNYGPRQYPEKLIPFFTYQALNNQPLPLYGDGRNVRDWIWVSDHVRALDLVMRRGRAGEVYNIGADNEQPNIEIAQRILDILQKPPSVITFVADRPGHDRRYAIDATKIKTELGWRPEKDFGKGLEETVRWYQDHRDWAERVREKTGVFNPHIDLWSWTKTEKT